MLLNLILCHGSAESLTFAILHEFESPVEPKMSSALCASLVGAFWRACEITVSFVKIKNDSKQKQSKAKQSKMKAKQGKAIQSKAKQNWAKQTKAKQNKAKQVKAKQS